MKTFFLSCICTYYTRNYINSKNLIITILILINNKIVLKASFDSLFLWGIFFFAFFKAYFFAFFYLGIFLFASLFFLPILFGIFFFAFFW